MFFKYREMTTYKLDLLETKRKPDKEMRDKGARLEIYHHPITTDAYGPNMSVFVVYHQKIINCKTKNDFGANCYSYPRFWIDNATGKIINIVEYQRFITSLWEDVLVEYHEITGQNKIFRENLFDWVAKNGRRAHSHKLNYQKSSRPTLEQNIDRVKNDFVEMVEVLANLLTKPKEELIEPQIIELKTATEDEVTGIQVTKENPKPKSRTIALKTSEIEKFIKNKRRLKTA